MTTLKQIQEKICNSKPHCTLDENDNCEKCSRLAVREFLQQKQQTDKEIEKEWKEFRKLVSTCNSIRTDEVTQFIKQKQKNF